MATLPVTVTTTDHNGQIATSVGGSVTPGSVGTPTSVKEGVSTIAATDDNGNGNLLCAQALTLSKIATIQSLSFYVTATGGQLRLGIYSDSGGKPNSKLAETNAFTPTTGWNTQPTLTTPTLQPGNYWLAYLPQSGALAFRKEPGTNYLHSFTFGVLPATFPASGFSDGSHWSFYGTFSEVSSVPTVWVNSVAPGGSVPPGGGTGGGGGTFPAVFQGNPNATVTAINTSSGIVMARSSMAMTNAAFVHVSASGITYSGTSLAGVLIPYEDLEYSWDFGDPSGTETFTSYGSPPNGVSVNSNTQLGPEAGYCYRTSGSKTITLRIRGKNGSGFTTATIQTTFNATVFNPSGGEWWYDSNATGANNGTSPTNAFTSAATLSGGSNNLGVANTAVHIAKGSSFTNQDINVAAGNIRIDTYGSGAKPAFNFTSGAHNPLNINNDIQDVVISGLALAVSGSTTYNGNDTLVQAAHGGSANPTGQFYFDNCDFSQTIGTGAGVMTILPADENVLANAQKWTQCGVWGGSCVNSQTNGLSLGMFIGANAWVFVYGTAVSGAGTDPIRHQHIYPNVQFHSVYRYINFGNGPGRDFCINTNWDPVPITVGLPIQYAEFILVAENNLTGGLQGGVDGGNNNNDIATENGRMRNFIIQNNSFHNLQQDCTGAEIVETQTLRDNYCWDICNGAGGIGVIAFELTNAAGDARKQIYRNNFYHANVGGAPTGEGILSWKNGTFNNPQVCTDNNIQDQRSGGGADIQEVWNGTNAAALAAAGSFFDRNNYYGPNSTLGFYTQSAPDTNVNFASWKATMGEANSTYTNGANPNWSNAAIGIFSS